MAFLPGAVTLLGKMVPDETQSLNKEKNSEFQAKGFITLNKFHYFCKKYLIWIKSQQIG